MNVAGADGEVVNASDGWGTARWRLRDLRGRDLALALGMLALVVAPFVLALFRGFRDGWIPSGDEANIATRALDVFSGHPPLTGLPSTSGLYGKSIATNHPGPIEFYLLAVPLRFFGMTIGPLLTAAAINGAFVVITLWVFFRRLGLTATVWAGVLLLAVMWSGGTAVLTDTLSSNMTMYSVLCTAVLVWALVDGDVRLLPLTTFVASYAAQQHLAAGLMVLALVAVAVVSVAVQVVVRVRRGDRELARRAWPAALLAVAVAIVCWTPVIIDEVTGDPGNITRIVNFAQDSSRAKLGVASGIDQWVNAVVPPTVLGHTDTTGSFFVKEPGAVTLLLGAAVFVVLVVIVVRGWKRRPSIARLALVGLVLVVAGIVNGSNVPKSFEADRVNLYRWTWAAALVTWAAIGMAIAVVVRGVAERKRERSTARCLLPVSLVVVAALIAVSILAIRGPDDHNRELAAFAAEKQIAAAVLANIDRSRPVFISWVGKDAQLAVVPHLIFRLVQAGVQVEVGSSATQAYGAERRHTPGNGATTISVSSGWARRPAGFGKVLAYQPFGPGRTKEFDELAARRSALLDDLAASLRGKKIELAPDARALIMREHPGLPGYILGLLLNNLSADPLTALGDPTFLQMLRKGIVRSPAIDQGKIIDLLLIPRYRHAGPFGDDQVEVHLLTPEQAAWCARHPCFSPQ